jgi:regulator of nucleoside diphosphate kinase
MPFAAPLRRARHPTHPAFVSFTMNKNVHSGTAKPPIHISETDYALIASHAMRLEATAPQVAKMLLDEIDRAEVYSRDELPNDVATLGSAVTFVDESTGVRRCVQIVLPADADIERSSLSIHSQVGAGLIGLRAGQSIEWPYPDGRPRTLRIVDVEQNPALDSQPPSEEPQDLVRH